MFVAPSTTTASVSVSTTAATSAAKRPSHVGEGLLHAGHERHGNGGRRFGWLSSSRLSTRWGTLVTVAHARGRLVAKLVSRRSRCDILRECWARRCMGGDWFKRIFHESFTNLSARGKLQKCVVDGHSLTAMTRDATAVAQLKEVMSASRVVGQQQAPSKLHSASRCCDSELARLQRRPQKVAKGRQKRRRRPIQRRSEIALQAKPALHGHDVHEHRHVRSIELDLHHVRHSPHGG